MEKKNCDACSGLCCKYVALEIDCPEDEEDFEDIKWYVLHEKVAVYVEDDGTWNLEFITPCKYVNEDGKCSVHEEFTNNPEIKRPNICKEFNVDVCPFHNEYNEKYRFEKIEDVENYIKNVFKKGKHFIPEDEEDED